MSNSTDRQVVAFAAIDPYLQSNIALPTEVENAKKNLVYWGRRNDYPDYLLDLRNSVPSLRSIIDGAVDYVLGDEVTVTRTYEGASMNRSGDTVEDIVRELAMSYFTYGGFAILVVRDRLGRPAELYSIDMRFLRMNKDCNVFYYNEHWDKSGSRQDYITYPAFMKDGQADASVLFVKDVRTQVYPSPRYAASIKACEIERSIDDFHLNSLENNFMSSAIVNFNNGIPDDETRREVEKDFNEKFSGHDNAGRIVLSWNRDKESATTIEYPKVEDFGARYDALAKHSRQQIYTAFRANPNLFGIPTDSLGFSSEEYESAFKLFNRTTVKPAQKRIADAFAKIYGEDVLTIRPFSLEGDNEQNVR